MTRILRGLIFLLCSVTVFAQDWPVVGRDAGGTRHSTLNQINRANVTKLQVAWTFDTGDWSDGTEISRSSLRQLRS